MFKGRVEYYVLSCQVKETLERLLVEEGAGLRGVSLSADGVYAKAKLLLRALAGCDRIPLDLLLSGKVSCVSYRLCPMTTFVCVGCIFYMHCLFLMQSSTSRRVVAKAKKEAEHALRSAATESQDDEAEDESRLEVRLLPICLLLL
jgi:hypothetical protein